MKGRSHPQRCRGALAFDKSSEGALAGINLDTVTNPNQGSRRYRVALIRTTGEKLRDQTTTAPAVQEPVEERRTPLRSVKTPAQTTPALAATLELDGA